MKPALRLSLLLFALLAAPVLRAADDDAAPRRTQAEALLQAMRTEQVLLNATTRVHQMVDRYSQQGAGPQTNLSPDQQAAMKKAQEEAHAIINQQLGWDAVKNDFTQAYADAFTLDELKALTDFYRSPLGQKLVEKQPPVTEKMGRLTQQKMMAAMPAIMAKIREGAPKKPVPPAVASPGPSVSAPAVAPVPVVPAASPAPAASAPPPAP